MTWPPDIANELPAPRDDEPASLRRDIADELADHLVTSLNRELHFTSEESAAKRTILDRFGDPRRIARQLWFDALQEKIMSQRVLIAAVMIIAIACLGGAGLMVMLVRQVSDTNQAMQEQMAQNREANAALLDKLAKLTVPAPASATLPRSLEFNPVKVRIAKDAVAGAPGEGYTVKLEGFLFGTAERTAIDRKTGTDGIADFGLIRAGEHNCSVRTPWDESGRPTKLSVLPGTDVNQELICPGGDRPDAALSFQIEWPDDLRQHKLWIVCVAEEKPRPLGGRFWVPYQSSRLLVIRSDDCAATPALNVSLKDTCFQFAQYRAVDLPGLAVDKTLIERLSREFFRKPENQRVAMVAGPRQPPPKSESAFPRPLRPYLFRVPDVPATEQIRLPASNYLIKHILLCEPGDDPVPQSLRTLNVLGGLSEGIHRGWNDATAVADGTTPPITDWNDDEDRPIDPIAIAKAWPKFEIKSDQTNSIPLSLPKKLLDNFHRFTKWAD